VVLAGEGNDLVEALGVGQQGFFAEHGLAEGEDGAQQVEMAGVFRADDKAVDFRIGKKGIEVGDKGAGCHFGVAAAAVGDVVPDGGDATAVVGLQDVFDEALGVDVGGGEEGEAGGFHSCVGLMRISLPVSAER
jgi:hypothetical protein